MNDHINNTEKEVNIILELLMSILLKLRSNNIVVYFVFLD